MSDFTFQVDLKGMIRLLSENLYSNDSVFLRELLQNAIDAIEARRTLQPDFSDGAIGLRLFDDGSLEFSDNGIGLTETEIHEFLSVIGKSSKREDRQQQSFIGQFGIGLLSCFLVADNIEVLTRAVGSGTAYRWIGQSDGAYRVQPEPSYTRQGTTVRLTMTPSMRLKYDGEVIRAHLAEYGFLIPTPIWLETDRERLLINDAYIPFREQYATREQLLDFGESVFGRTFLDVVQLQGDGIQGCIYFSATPTNSTTMLRHKIYLKHMLITDDGKDLVPKWAFFAQCFLNAEDLTPTASRESFYRDQKLANVKVQIESCIIGYLAELAETAPERLTSILLIHSTAIKSLAADHDRVFQLLFPFLSFATNAGEVTGRKLMEVAGRTPVYFCTSVDEFRKIRPLLEDRRTLLINAGYVYDSPLIRRAKRVHRAHRFIELTDEMIGDILQPAAGPQEVQLADFISHANRALQVFECRVLLRCYTPRELASLFVPGAAGFTAGSSQEDFLSEDLFKQEDELDGFSSSCLYLNAACPLISRIGTVSDPKLFRILAEVLYLQAHMQGGYPLDGVKLRLLNGNLTRLMELGLG